MFSFQNSIMNTAQYDQFAGLGHPTSMLCKNANYALHVMYFYMLSAHSLQQNGARCNLLSDNITLEKHSSEPLIFKKDMFFLSL